MNRSLSSALFVLSLLAPPLHAQQTSTSVSIETIKLELIDPARYQIPIILRASRRAELVATSEGVLKSLTTQVGATVREGQEIAKLDQADLSADLAIAQAELKENQAELKTVVAAFIPITQAKIEASQARVQKAQNAVDRAVIRAPFPGRILDINVTPGQFCQKGMTLVEIADISTLRALTPIERPPGGAAGRAGLIGKTTKLIGEDGPSDFKIEAILPPSDIFMPLKDLQINLSSAWVSIANNDGTLEPGMRFQSPILPDAPIALVPSAAVKSDDLKTLKPKTGPYVQVLRNEYVTEVPVRILGKSGQGRTQVCGEFRPSDALIVFSKVPLVAGTLVRFEGGSAPTPGMEARPPDPSARGTPAQVVAPIGAPGSRIASPSPNSTAPAAGVGTPKAKAATPPAGNSGVTPF